MTLNSCTIPLEQDASGVIRVENTRVTLDSIVLAYREGSTAEEIAEEFPTVSLGAIYAVITFVLQNGAEVNAYLSRRDHAAEELRRNIESRPETIAFRKRLMARMAARRSS